MKPDTPPQPLLQTPAHTPPQAMLAQADLLLLLADGFRSPAAQSAPPLAAVTKEDVDNLLSAAAIADGEAVAAALKAAIDAAAGIDAQAWSDEYHRLFEGAMLCPLNETAYIRRDKGAILGDICAFYRAFGWQVEAASAEKPDHLSCELEFTAMLMVMLAAAEQDGQAERIEVTRNALAGFAGAHTGDWLDAVCARIGECTHLPAMAALGRALEVLWSALSRHWSWPQQATATAPAPEQEPESPYDCIVPGFIGHTPDPEPVAVTHGGKPIPPVG